MPRRKRRPRKSCGSDGESDEDEADSDNQSEVEDMKAGEGKAGGKEEGKGPDASGDLNEDDGGRGGAKKRIDPPAIKMDEESAKTLLQGSECEAFVCKVTDVSCIRLMSPYDRNKYWASMREQAINLLEAIRKKMLTWCLGANNAVPTGGCQRRKSLWVQSEQLEKETQLKTKPC